MQRTPTLTSDGTAPPALMLLGGGGSEGDFSAFLVLHNDGPLQRYSVAGLGYRNGSFGGAPVLENGLYTFTLLKSLRTLANSEQRLLVAADRVSVGGAGTTFFDAYAAGGNSLLPNDVSGGAYDNVAIVGWDVLPTLGGGMASLATIRTAGPARPPEIYRETPTTSASVGQVFTGAAIPTRLYVFGGESIMGELRGVAVDPGSLGGTPTPTQWQVVGERRSLTASSLGDIQAPPLVPPPMPDGVYRPGVLLAGENSSLLFFVAPQTNQQCAQQELRVQIHVVNHVEGGAATSSRVSGAEICIGTPTPYFHVTFPAAGQSGQALVTLTAGNTLVMWTATPTAGNYTNSITAPAVLPCMGMPAAGYLGNSINPVLCQRLPPTAAQMHDRLYCESAGLTPP